MPTMRYAANSLWQLLSFMAFNLVRGFQVLATAEYCGTTRKRGCVYRFESIHTLRYQYFHRAGVIVRPDGHAILDVGSSPVVQKLFSRVDALLNAA